MKELLLITCLMPCTRWVSVMNIRSIKISLIIFKLRWNSIEKLWVLLRNKIHPSHATKLFIRWLISTKTALKLKKISKRLSISTRKQHIISMKNQWTPSVHFFITSSRNIVRLQNGLEMLLHMDVLELWITSVFATSSATVLKSIWIRPSNNISKVLIRGSSQQNIT